ncbi:hypothetical protein QTJ16_002350 [Diplocarpon rosae]|uniref:Uncharacterized protein n=1 Tax=Diplocarpon rosae TaxID=946125 RepID=A0AAD9T2U6_9HELO|nr:hypothetical protein QTJ16_002350 [Diplocarpon rosae]
MHLVGDVCIAALRLGDRSSSRGLRGKKKGGEFVMGRGEEENNRTALYTVLLFHVHKVPSPPAWEFPVTTRREGPSTTMSQLSKEKERKEKKGQRGRVLVRDPPPARMFSIDDRRILSRAAETPRGPKSSRGTRGG